MMTREEAINVLGNFKRYISGGGVTSRTDTEAINMAIEALEQSERSKVNFLENFETTKEELKQMKEEANGEG